MKIVTLILFALLFACMTSLAQVGINSIGDGPDPSAMLDVKSSDKGFLPPRMTTAQMNSIVLPMAGLLVYNTSTNALYWFDGTNWQRFNEFNYTESDPVFLLHPAHSVSLDLIINWNSAYGWGNHATAGYLTSFNETDPVFGIHPSYNITQTNIDQWNQAYLNRVNSASGTSPLTLNLQNNQLSGFILQAGAAQSGYLSSVDWNTFNNKQNTVTFGNLTSSDITVTGGTTSVKGAGASLAINKGNLTSSDLTVTGGTGAVLGTGSSLAVKKGNLTETGSSVLTITGGSNAVLGTGSTIQVKQAGTAQSGYLSTTDFNSFNNKVSSQWIANGVKLHYNTGNVGVGTSNPQNKIDIAGNAVIGSTYSGNISAPVNGLLVQGKLGVGTPAPLASASLEVTSTTTGVLLPRMTLDQRNAIANPAEGLMVFCTDCGTKGSLSVYSCGSWITFSPCTSPVPSAASNTITPGQIIWKWNAAAGATGYKWGTTTSYSAATDMAAATSKTETGISCDSTFNRYLWSYNSCGVSEITNLAQAISATVPATPEAATHVATQTSIVWKWSAVTGAIGYKWSMVNDLALAIDVGADTTKTETGDTCGTAYTRFVWAYNGCGYSAVDTLTQSTLPCWTCGISTLTINHVITSGVAPVDKTTTYGTVTNIPGEMAKCWITSNLGASQQATAVNDGTEAAAGWYWQFNCKQGYKHDGTDRTPNTTWISSILENSDWLTANDPCNLELGIAWRLPTYTEWYNVDNTGEWNSWNDPWGSGLKLHAAGYLKYGNGSLDIRGSYGSYWSIAQYDATGGWSLHFFSGISYLNYSNKAYGFSARCLRE